MNYSALEICNKALRFVGQMPLTEDEFTSIQTKENLNENTIANAVVRQLYPNVKDEVLDTYNWKVATKHVKLTNPQQSNNHKFKYYFLLPLNVIRLISANGDFTRDGLYVYSNKSSINISYIARIEEQEMNFRLVNLIALRLAMDLCLCVLNDDDKLKVLKQRFYETLDMSQKLDALEEQESIELAKDIQYSWIKVRR